MRKALLVGIDDYPHSPLQGCVNDALAMAEVLHQNEDRSPNFSCKTLVSSDTQVTASRLVEQTTELFRYEADIALFYFSGHGIQNEAGWHLVTQEATQYDPGVDMTDIVEIANNSKVREKIIIIDCCESGGMGISSLLKEDSSVIPRGMTILASSASNQPSVERNGAGEFTDIVVEGLKGEAADILGRVTISGIFNLADTLLGPWEQRPQFKANLSTGVSLRNCHPKIDLEILRKLPEYFEQLNTFHPLSPHYDESLEPRDPEKEAIFSDIRALARVGMVVPIGEKYLYWAAFNNKSCGLTSLGRFYWKLAQKKLI